jgi:hypothetical protein
LEVQLLLRRLQVGLSLLNLEVIRDMELTTKVHDKSLRSQDYLSHASCRLVAHALRVFNLVHGLQFERTVFIKQQQFEQTNSPLDIRTSSLDIFT